ncbi:MAG: ABC transporter ATP-binding protein [Coriobacteriia bacterium]|nr:ABC transporter ATP-binding protein [Coriobacteriia bacterium]
MSLAVKNLSYAYGKHEVLHDLSFEIEDGMLVNVLGPNGVGKSTLFKCMLGLLPNYSGEIFVNGKNLKSLNIKERSREIAYIPQTHASIYDFRVLDVVLMSTGNNLGVLATPSESHVNRALDALDRVGVVELSDRPFTQISGGQQQLVLVARAIAQNARTIIMDEPTSALDFGNTVRILSTVRQLARDGLSIIQSTHQPDQAFLYSDKTMVINKGRLHAFAPPKEILTSTLVSEIYKVDIEVNSLYEDRVRVCIPIKEVQER